MDIIANSLGTNISFSPFFSHLGKLESGNKSPSAIDQCVGLPGQIDVDNSTDSHKSTSASSSSDEETVGKDDDCDKMLEKWRLIRLSDRNKAQKKIYRTDDAHTALLGRNYSKFYSAFRQGITPMTPKPTATTAPVKRSAATSEPASKRRRTNDPASLPPSDQHHPRTTPARRSAVVTMKIPKRLKLKELASPSEAVGESSVTPRPRSHSETKEQQSKRRGVGLYAGNWEYATNEEKVPEYLSVAEKIADLEGRTTRRAYAKMTSGEGAGDSGNTLALSPGKEVRKSGRARNTVDYTRLSGPENNDRGIATSEQIEEGRMSPAQRSDQMSPSTSASSTSIISTLLPDNPSRSTSTSTATNTEQHERPNRSWNAIVYEILATSDIPLTFPQLVQSIKNRYPFFNSSSQDKVLKSGPKNPLYFHEAFCRAEVVNGKQTWALKPGRFVDKKTGEVLTPQPRYTISSPRIAEQVREAEDRNPGDVTSKTSHPHNPRSSIPRFGREILNSPEIPDSQDVRAITSSPQETNSRIATEHPPHLEYPYQHAPPSVRYPTHELSDAADGTSAVASDRGSLSGQIPQPHLQWATTTGSPMSSTPTIKSPIAAGTKLQGILKLIDTVDRNASATGAQSLSAFQAVEPHRSSISSSPSMASSTGENGNGSISTITQPPSISIPLVRTVSPTEVPTLSESRAVISHPPPYAPISATPSVTNLASMQLEGILVDGKAGAKEPKEPTCNDGSKVPATLPSFV